MPVYADPAGGATVRALELESWTAALVERVGTPADIAADVAAVLVASDRRGIASHGTARLEHEIELLVGARTAPNAPGRVLIPGEPEAAAERRSDERGISLDEEHLKDLEGLAERYDVPLPETTPL